LRDIPLFEESGLLARVPVWWKGGRPARPQSTSGLANWRLIVLDEAQAIKNPAARQTIRRSAARKIGESRSDCVESPFLPFRSVCQLTNAPIKRISGHPLREDGLVQNGPKN
jgi:hypothetical protein